MSNAISFEFSEAGLKSLDNMSAKAGLTSRKDTLNAALTLFEWALDQRSQGRTIASIDEPNSQYGGSRYGRT